MIAALRNQTAPGDCIAAALAIAPRLAEFGARYDAAPVFPLDSMKIIAASGLAISFAPIASGGTDFADARAHNGALMTVLRIIGRADLSIGRLFEGHVNALALFDWFGTTEQKQMLAQVLGRGAFFGVWATEPAPGVTIQGKTLVGAKSFATGAGGLDYAVVTARPPTGDRRLVIVPADRPDRVHLEAWRVRGMRATGSGRYDLDGIDVRPADLLGVPGDYDREPRFTTGAWRFTAVQLGGIEGLLQETRNAMSPAAREDPIQRARFADAIVATRTAYLWVRECAQRAADDDADGPAFARLTRGMVERAALDVMEAGSRIVGTRSAMDGERIDKIIRDLSLYLRQSGQDHAKDEAARAWLDRDAWGSGDLLW